MKQRHLLSREKFHYEGKQPSGAVAAGRSVMEDVGSV